MDATLFSNRVEFTELGNAITLAGSDIIRGEVVRIPAPNAPGNEVTFVRLYLCGDAKLAYGDYYDVDFRNLANQPTWTDRVDTIGAFTCLEDLAPIFRRPISTGGGGQVDTIVPGDAIDVDSTDPANPIVNVKVDGVTIGFNGSNELESIVTGGITQLTGDVTAGPGSGSQAATLASVIAAGGPTGSATVAPIITYDAKGRLTAVSSATITPAASSITSPQALTRVDDTNVTLTLGGTPSTALLQPASITAGWTGQLAVARGGTGLASGTSGGVLGFTASGTIASSALLAANSLMVGGGAGATPSTVTTGTGVVTALSNAPNTSGGFALAGTVASSLTLLPMLTSSSLQWINMPSALTFFNGAGRWVACINLVGRSQAKVNVYIPGGGSFVAGSKIRLLYRTRAAGYSSTITDYLQLGASAQVETTFAAGFSIYSSAWIDIATLAKDDIIIAVAGIDGDGAADPVFIAIDMEYR